jgi:hypothetical protein
MSGDSNTFLCVKHGEVSLVEIVAEVSRRIGVPFRALELQALMHLPRLADNLGMVDKGDAKNEIERLAREIPPGEAWKQCTARAARDLLLGPVDEKSSRWICEQFHYLRSHRLDGRHYGAFAKLDGSLPIALAVTVPVDVPSLEAVLGSGKQARRSRVVARVFAFPGAPRNSLSRLLAFVARIESHELESQWLLTYVNPNLGFRGESYLASGWTLAGDEPGTTYRYLDGRYITDRELKRRFGDEGDAVLRSILGSRFSISVMPLRPLLVFSRDMRLRSADRRQPSPYIAPHG